MNARGFTLIELMVVMAIIATLLTIATPRYFAHLDRAKEAALRETLSVTRDAIDKFYGDMGRYPKSLDELVEKRYLRRVPFDPITDSSETWTLLPPPTNVETEPLTLSEGVWDLHSGATDEGKAYDQW